MLKSISVTVTMKYDLSILFSYFCLKKVACVSCTQFLNEETYMLYKDTNKEVSKQQLKEASGLADLFIDLFFNFASRFNTFEMTDSEIALFAALILVSPGKYTSGHFILSHMYDHNCFTMN